MTLLDGRDVADADLTFDPQTYHFFLGSEDVTNDISRADKLRLVPDFDVTKENYRISNESGTAAGKYGDQPLNDSTASNFANQILTDPLSAPLDALDKGVRQVFSSTGATTLLAVGVGLLILIVVIRKNS